VAFFFGFSFAVGGKCVGEGVFFWWPTCLTSRAGVWILGNKDSMGWTEKDRRRVRY
jgi:hypothetical protein